MVNSPTACNFSAAADICRAATSQEVDVSEITSTVDHHPDPIIADTETVHIVGRITCVLEAPIRGDAGTCSPRLDG